MTDNYEELNDIRKGIINSFKESLSHSTNNIFELINEFHGCVIKETLSVYDESDFINEMLKCLHYK